MAWYNYNIGKGLTDLFKRNPVQPMIARDEGFKITSREIPTSYWNYYENLEIVNRGVNMIIDDVAQIPVKVGDMSDGFKRVVKTPKKSTVIRLLNHQPNQFQDISSFKRLLISDFLIDGNIFIYWDGAELFHIPAYKMEVIPDTRNFIKGYTYNEERNFTPEEIIHVKENSFRSIYRGVPRLKPAQRTMQLYADMRKFQDNFFKNGAVPGLVIKTPNTMSEKLKERTIAFWNAKFKPTSGGYSPMILDGGTEIDKINDIDFKKLAFEESMVANKKVILEALGIPPILFEGGNNANIRPNHRLYYLETILPIVRNINFAFERFFGFEIKEDVRNIPALQPELKEQANFYSSLVNAGILTPNEGRLGVGMDELEDQDMDKIRIPANIAGSAGDPSEGGRPEGEDEDEDE